MIKTLQLGFALACGIGGAYGASSLIAYAQARPAPAVIAYEQENAFVWAVPVQAMEIGECQIRSKRWTNNVILAAMTYSEQQRSKTHFTSEQYQQIDEFVGGYKKQVEALIVNLGPNPCQILAHSPILEHLDALEAAATNNYH